jgi:hypothetical protein
MKISKWKRTCDLPACSAVPQTAAPPRPPPRPHSILEFVLIYFTNSGGTPNDVLAWLGNTGKTYRKIIKSLRRMHAEQ